MTGRHVGAHRRPRSQPLPLRILWAVSAAVVGFGLVSAPASAAAGDPVTHVGHTYPTSIKRPTENKPQSKLWYAAGSWWSLMTSGTRVHIYELLANNTWRDTGVLVDSRLNATGDAHWDASDATLTVLSRDDLALHVARFSLTGRTWVPQSGFPIVLSTGGGAESGAIDRDSTGRYWVTYTRSSRVWVAHSDQVGRNWTAGYQPAVPDVTIKGDDISSVIAFDGRIGVMWSDQQSHAFRMAVHVDGAPDQQWTVEDALTGTNWADDHLNLKTDGSGKVFAAVKTGLDAAGANAPLVGVLTRTPRANGTGDWSFASAGTVADDHTRPIIQIDATNNRLYFFATAPVSGGDIYFKTSSLSNVSFGSGRGDKFIDAQPYLNNATGSKQPVTSETGMIVLAVAEGKKTYYHGAMSLGGGGGTPPPGDTTPPTTPGGLMATPSAGQVDLSWDASSDASGINGYVLRRDGSVIADIPGRSYRDTAVSPNTTYSYTVQARDNAGLVSGQSSAVEATVPGGTPPPTGGQAAFRAGATAANSGANSLTVPVPTHQPGDLLLATVDYRGQATITPPAGWTEVRQDANGTAMRKATYWRVAQSGEPTGYTWNFSAKPAAVGAMLSYSGVSTSAPVESQGALVTAKSTAVTAPSVPASVGSQVVGLFGVARLATFTPPAGTTERTEVASPGTVSYPMAGSTADRAHASGGTTGTLVATSSVNGPNIGHTVVLRSAG